jgi:aryl-alcohol dehydrogenase-like predicted oxidoreductase
MQKALEVGIKWFDTAPFYGHGHSEKVVGRFIAHIREPERPFMFTKCGLVWDETDLSRPSTRNLSPSSIRRECEASLRRLGFERIDLLQFHWPDRTGTPIEESWREVQRLIEEGKVRWAGVSNFGSDLLEACEAVGHVDSVQPPFSLVNRAAVPALLTWAREHGAGLICYSPMASGLLTDHFSLEYWSTLPAEDWRRSPDWFGEEDLRRGLALRDALRPIARRHGTIVSSVAVAWTLAWEGITGV